MKKTTGSGTHSYAYIIIIMLVAMAIVQLFITFKGLYDPVAMDQAQIARQVARGEGMTTKFIRPMALATSYNVATEKAKKEEAELKREARQQDKPTDDITVPLRFNSLAMDDTNNAPLNILVNALALKISGADNYDNWKIESGVYLYTPDRIIAGVSMIFFMLSVWCIYRLIRRIFDAGIASITSVLIILSSLFLEFAISGLPQMMMLFFFTLGINFAYTALEKQEDKKSPFIPLLLASLAFALLCLASWVGIWPFLGFLLFIGIFFRPHGVYCLPAIVIFLLLAGWSIYHNYDYSGNPFGIAVYSIYEGISGDQSLIMRVLTQRDVPIYPQLIFTQVLGSSLQQVNMLYSNMGGIIVTPFFFLALFHPFKNRNADKLKWGVFLIWVLSTVGMALYSDGTAANSSQMQILCSPLFTAFGLAMLFIMIGRLNTMYNHIKGLKPFLVAVVILVSSGSLLMSMPQDLRRGLQMEHSGLPQWPPYLPPVLNVNLHDATNPEQVIATDQPWAVAWYADRAAMWLPRKKDDFFTLENILKENDSSVGGILITPSSHSGKNGLRGSISEYGDFAPFVAEGAIIELFPEYSAFLNSASNRAAEKDPLLARFRHSRARLMLMGFQIIYYSETPVENNR